MLYKVFLVGGAYECLYLHKRTLVSQNGDCDKLYTGTCSQLKMSYKKQGKNTLNFVLFNLLKFAFQLGKTKMRD